MEQMPIQYVPLDFPVPGFCNLLTTIIAIVNMILFLTYTRDWSKPREIVLMIAIIVVNELLAPDRYLWGNNLVLCIRSVYHSSVVSLIAALKCNPPSKSHDKASLIAFNVSFPIYDF